jgi:shikimate dehydrogenase
MELNDHNLIKSVANADMIVNTTSVGMGAGRDQSPIPARLLQRSALVYDIVYNPLKTRLISEAESAGCVTISGAEMLAWQGALAFEKWTAHKAPIELMKREVIRHLKNED